MPSATRNINPYSTTDGSAPGKLNIPLKTRAEIPSVAAKESMVVASRISGARMDLRSAMRISVMTISTAGMTTARSCSALVLVSSCTAAVPPMRIDSSTSWSEVRRRSIVACAASESAASLRVTSRSSSPSTVLMVAWRNGYGSSSVPSGSVPDGELSAFADTDATPVSSVSLVTVSSSSFSGTMI